ncbi:uncharacterized protein LOC118454129 [Neolamprologus brichardi]|uniref:uncharacterized protein LOC118454129 n=1 Tax=Neolamprologus brichardi TaxID=32507 RepID=UPI001643B54D|nr:uncharacterized protein LOC118454129 [Neolamprologus brichardi]
MISPSINIMIVSVYVFALVLLPGLQPSAAESPSSLTCNSTRLPNGSVLFQLPHGPSSSSCRTCWEDQNKTVMARGSRFYEAFVHSLTDDSIILADCRPLRYILECSGMLQEIDCAVNCSSHLDPASPSPNSTHPDKPEWITGAIAVSLLSSGIIVIVMLWRFYKKKRSVTTPTAQSVVTAWSRLQRLRYKADALQTDCNSSALLIIIIIIFTSSLVIDGFDPSLIDGLYFSTLKLDDVHVG